MGLFQRSASNSFDSGYVPLWQEPAAPAPAPVEPGEKEPADDSLNRLQRSLIWFAAMLIAVSMFINIRNNF